MKKLTTLIIILASYLISSCSSKEEVAVVVKKPTKIIRGTRVINFSYENNLLSKVSSKDVSNSYTDISEFSYSNGKIKQIYSYGIDQSSGILKPSTHVFNYTGDLITSSTNNENGTIYSNTYIYNNSNLLINRKEFKQNGVLNTNYDFEYFPDGNLKKRIEGNYTLNYADYDIYNNYLNLILTPELRSLYAFSKNNILLDDNYSYNYEYNVDNYPTKLTMKEGNNIISTSIIEYN